MIHKIKALYDEGRGLSIRAIGKELGVSRNTVRKHLRTEESVMAAAQTDRRRHQRLDGQRTYIAHLLERFPKLSCVKLARKLRAKLGPLEVSERTLRRYVRQVKKTVACAQPRYYEPVLDMVPGVQCQVDPGELRRVMIGGAERTVHFVVFVLPLLLQMRIDPVEDHLGQVVLLQQPTELQQGRGIRGVFAAQVDPDKTPDHLAVVDRILDPFIRQVEALLGHVHPQHPLQTNRRTAALPLRVVRLDRLHQRRPGRDRIDLPQKPVTPRLLALGGVLEIGKTALGHRPSPRAENLAPLSQTRSPEGSGGGLN